jgi:hypothetical protein
VRILSNPETKSLGVNNYIGVIQTDGSNYKGEIIYGVYVMNKEEVIMLKKSALITIDEVISEEEFYDELLLREKMNKYLNSGRF